MVVAIAPCAERYDDANMNCVRKAVLYNSKKRQQQATIFQKQKAITSYIASGLTAQRLLVKCVIRLSLNFPVSRSWALMRS